MMRRTTTTNAPARNAHPRLRLVAPSPSRNPYETLRRESRNAGLQKPRTGYRELVRRLWQPAA